MPYFSVLEFHFNLALQIPKISWKVFKIYFIDFTITFVPFPPLWVAGQMGIKKSFSNISSIFFYFMSCWPSPKSMSFIGLFLLPNYSLWIGWSGFLTHNEKLWRIWRFPEKYLIFPLLDYTWSVDCYADSVRVLFKAGCQDY